MSRFTQDMQRRMQDSGISQARLAGLIHVHPSYLSLITNGHRNISTKLANAIDKALDAGGQLAALAEQPTPVVPAPRRPLGEEDAAAARATTAHLVGLDTLHGSTGIDQLAVRSFRSAADRLAVVGGTADVRSAVADLGAAAAWITSDAVQRDKSRAIALEALALADMADDTRLRRFLLSHLSMVSEHGGRYGDALAYADRLLAEHTDNPRVQAMIEIRHARALSGLGDMKAALTAWDRAQGLLQETPLDNDGLTYWIHAAEMAIHRSVILTRGGDKTALDWARFGIENLPAQQGRDQVLFRTMLLHNAVVARAWRDVPAIVEDLLTYACAGTGSARVPERLDTVWRLVNTGRVPATVRDAVHAARESFQ